MGRLTAGARDCCWKFAPAWPNLKWRWIKRQDPQPVSPGRSGSLDGCAESCRERLQQLRSQLKRANGAQTTHYLFAAPVVVWWLLILLWMELAALARPIFSAKRLD